MSILLTTLLPSYKRPVLLMSAIESFRKTAKNPECHEVIVRLSQADDQAQATKDAVMALFGNCKVIVGKQMGGYVALGLYYTEMLPEATGEWINIWDDDMTIEGPPSEGTHLPKWDELLQKAPHKAMVVCERYQLGPNLYDPGSLDGAGTGWFVHYATWRATGETEIGFPPDAYMARLRQRHNWPVHRLPHIILNHQWQRPRDGDR